MLTPRVDINSRAFAEAATVLDPKQLRRIRWSAQSEAARAGRTIISREVRDELALSAGAVNEQIEAKRFGGDGVQLIEVTRKGVSMREYGARQTRAGVSVRIRKDKGRQIIRKGFGPNISKLNKGVFKRDTKKRLPIRKLYGPTVVAVVANEPGLLGRATDKIADTLLNRVDSKLALALTRKNAFT